MKVDITGASAFIRRMYEAGGNFQWAREFLMNSLEAEASRVEFGLEWQAVEHLGVYRRTVADDGSGMSRLELERYFRTLGAGAKVIGDVHDNFGVGARIAALPWNPDGVVVISFKDDEQSMIWIVLDEDSGDYELVDFEGEDGTIHCVVDPAEVYIDGTKTTWLDTVPDFVRKAGHGTTIVLLGAEDEPDTILGDPHAENETEQIKGLSMFLNTRFWQLTKVDVVVHELRSVHRNRWPKDPNDRDPGTRLNARTIMGARHFLTADGKNGKLLDADIVFADDGRVPIEWYLWEGDRPHIDSYARKGGYIAVRYKNELYHLTWRKAHFKWFGVIESEVQHRLTLVLEPKHFVRNNGQWGVYPDQSRNRLNFTGHGTRGGDLPLSDWGYEFATNIPEPVLEAIKAARGGEAGSLDDEEYRQRLQDKFGDRWAQRVKARRKRGREKIGGDAAEGTEVFDIDPESRKNRTRKKTKKRLKRIIQAGLEGDEHDAIFRESPVSIPRYYPTSDADLFESPEHLATWMPNDPQEPTVYINTQAPILRALVEYHQERYADHFAEEVQRIVQNTIGEIAVAKIAHTAKLPFPVEELDRTYRSEAALTTALMGLLAEDSLIGQRLGRLGRRVEPEKDDAA